MRGRLSDLSRDNSPGPGAYDPSDSFSVLKNPTFKVGRSKRDYLSNFNALPGPGTYDPKTLDTSLGISLRGKIDIKGK